MAAKEKYQRITGNNLEKNDLRCYIILNMYQ